MTPQRQARLLERCFGGLIIVAPLSSSPRFLLEGSGDEVNAVVDDYPWGSGKNLWFQQDTVFLRHSMLADPKRRANLSPRRTSRSSAADFRQFLDLAPSTRWTCAATSANSTAPPARSAASSTSTVARPRAISGAAHPTARPPMMTIGQGQGRPAYSVPPRMRTIGTASSHQASGTYSRSR